MEEIRYKKINYLFKAIMKPSRIVKPWILEFTGVKSRDYEFLMHVTNYFIRCLDLHPEIEGYPVNAVNNMLLDFHFDIEGQNLLAS